MIEDSAAAGITLIDMGKGEKRYKETLKTSDLFVCEGAVTGRSPLALAHRAASRRASGRAHDPGPPGPLRVSRRGAQAVRPGPHLRVIPAGPGQFPDEIWTAPKC